MSETEAKQKWTSSPGWQRVPAEGCRHAIKIDCGICHAEEFERGMEKPSKLEDSIKDIQLSVAGMMSAEDIVYLSDQAAKYKKALEEIFKFVNSRDDELSSELDRIYDIVAGAMK